MNTHVDFETAKLLKEKGFDLEVNSYYSGLNFYTEQIKSNFNNKTIGDTPMHTRNAGFYSAPTISEVVMWLYEEHGIWIVVETALGEDVKCLFSWYCTDDEQNTLCSDFDYTKDSKYHYNSPTEAYQEAISYTLKNLI